MSLYPFQEELVARTAAALTQHRAVVMQLGTGGGKTHTLAEVSRRRHTRRPHGRQLFLAGLDAIVGDTHRRYAAALPHVGRIQAGYDEDPSAPVQVGSWQTIAARGARPPADLVIVDECHHATAATLREVVTAYPGALLLGTTATPQRGDGAPLGDVFDTMVCGPDNAWLCANGYLSPLEFVGPEAPENGLVCTPVEAYARWCDPGRRAIVFARTIAEARLWRDGFEAAGVAARLLTGQTPERARDAVRVALTDGTAPVVVTVGVAREGWDCPPVEVAIFACRVGVVGAWLQMLGRVSRPSPATGKARALAIDLCGSWVDLGFRDDRRVWSLTGDAVRNTDAATPLRRCTECLAIFRPCAACPRCGAPARVAAKLPRVLNRAERLARLEGVPQHVRDAKYLARLEAIALERMRKSEREARAWARAQFKRTRGRAPEVAA